MREIQGSEAKVCLASLLDDVERGETLIITRHGKAIARLIPEGDRRREEFEVRNGLVVNERRGRIQPGDKETFLDALERLSVAIDHAPDGKVVLALAQRHRLTFYDAAHIELGSRLGAPIATLDDRLAAAALGESIPMFSAS